MPEERREKYVEDSWFKEVDGEIRLMGSRCLSCNKVFFPIKPVCPDCFEGELATVPLSKRGKLHTFAHSILGPPGMMTPYVMGFIDLPEVIKLYSVLSECEPWDKVLKVGMDVEMTVGPISRDANGDQILSYKFKPVVKEK